MIIIIFPPWYRGSLVAFCYSNIRHMLYWIHIVTMHVSVTMTPSSRVQAAVFIYLWAHTQVLNASESTVIKIYLQWLMIGSILNHSVSWYRSLQPVPSFHCPLIVKASCLLYLVYCILTDCTITTVKCFKSISIYKSDYYYINVLFCVSMVTGFDGRKQWSVQW